jgi:putative aldouronate transport system substrate-binding protein
VKKLWRRSYNECFDYIIILYLKAVIKKFKPKPRCASKKDNILKDVHCHLLIIGLALSAIGCSAKQTKTTDIPKTAVEEPDKYDSLPKEITVEAFDRGAVSTVEGSYEENRWTKYINENSGVKVKWIPVPRAQAIDKMKVLFAAGQAPDLVWDFGRNFMGSLVNQGLVQPVDEFINKYSTVYKAYINSNADLKPFTVFNGKTYAFTTRRSIDSIANHGMWIRKDWLDKLGLKTPTTDKELLDVARAFTQKDPDGNGKNDTLGIAFNYNYTTIIRSIYGTSYYFTDNGKNYFTNSTMCNHDRYKDALTFQKTVYDEGLVDKEYLTDKNYTRERVMG